MIAALERIPVHRTGNHRLGRVANTETGVETAGHAVHDAINKRVFVEDVEAELWDVLETGVVVDVGGNLGGRGAGIVSRRAGCGAGLVIHRLGGPQPGAVDDGLVVAHRSPDDFGFGALDLIHEIGRAPTQKTGIAVRRADREEGRAEVERLFEIRLFGAVVQHLVFTFAAEEGDGADNATVLSRILGAEFPIHALFVLDEVIDAPSGEDLLELSEGRNGLAQILKRGTRGAAGTERTGFVVPKHFIAHEQTADAAGVELEGLGVRSVDAQLRGEREGQTAHPRVALLVLRQAALVADGMTPYVLRIEVGAEVHVREVNKPRIIVRLELTAGPLLFLAIAGEQRQPIFKH